MAGRSGLRSQGAADDPVDPAGPPVHEMALGLTITQLVGRAEQEVSQLTALAGLLGAPPELFAALGFVAVFAGATNTPVACWIMGMELFGARYGVPLGIACAVAFLCSGHRGIYRSQRFAVTKPGFRLRRCRTPGRGK